MGAPLLCADNIGSVTLYPRVTVTDQSGTSGPIGYEAWRAFRSSRNIFAYWQPGTTNALAFLQVQHEQPRTANFLALSYGHNLAGFPVLLYGSQDGAGFTAIVSATIPSVTGGILSARNGVLTEMGDWLITFPAASYSWWQFQINAMGAGLQPLIPSLQFGLSYQPLALYRPFMEHRTRLTSQMITTPLGWIGRGTRGFNRSGTLNLRADQTDYEYLRARLTIEEQFGSGRPMWVIEDQDRAQEAFCAVRPDGEQGFERPTQIFWPTASIQVFEHEPLGLN